MFFNILIDVIEYLIINQNNPNEQVARTEQLIFLNGQAGNHTIRRDNRVARFYFMNAGDGYNVKILAIRNTQKGLCV